MHTNHHDEHMRQRQDLFARVRRDDRRKQRRAAIARKSLFLATV